MINRAIAKYGIENFKKEYIGFFDNKEQMNLAERILVVVDRDVSYNLKRGGNGGFDYINENNLSLNFSHIRQNKLSVWDDPDKKAKFVQRNKPVWAATCRANYLKYGIPENFSFVNRSHSAETIDKMKRAKVGHGIGNSNSQWGTCWITKNGTNKKIPKDQLMKFQAEGWCKGRKL